MLFEASFLYMLHSFWFLLSSIFDIPLSEWFCQEHWAELEDQVDAVGLDGARQPFRPATARLTCTFFSGSKLHGNTVVQVERSSSGADPRIFAARL